MTGTIYKALSGFYYVYGEGRSVACRARGRFRHEGCSPLVGDRVRITETGTDTGVVDEILPRRNAFQRPAVANIDQLVIVASAATPATDPFLIDRMTAVAVLRGCAPVICVNKCDLVSGSELTDIYRRAGFPAFAVSAKTGQGLDALLVCLKGKLSAFTGNSGVGKSSLLNAIAPEMQLPVGEISEKLGRCRHTTRHVELFRLDGDAFVVDTPGFSSFDPEQGTRLRKEDLAGAFPDFAPYLGRCRFRDCAHVKEEGCAVLEALARGDLEPTRHGSYVRLYEIAKEHKDWEDK
ncbi:MAG: ribosome small subunit-dependent GTPase A [Oscillospiraceae bacterium]|nr:ribosome small subunit-dependent GTPase A [Oscillospiraceae bacterium]